MRIVNISELIKQAEELKSVPYDSPKVKLWERRVKTFVKENYGDEYLEILDGSLSFGQVIMGEAHGQQMHVKAMDKAIEFLAGLKTEPRLGKQ